MVAGFYRYCFEEQLIPVSPAAHVRRPRLDYEPHATGLDRNELGMFLVQAGLSGGRDHVLACLLALNGLRISEALNADIGQLGVKRGHRTLTITRKGGKIVTKSRWRPAPPELSTYVSGNDKKDRSSSTTTAPVAWIGMPPPGSSNGWRKGEGSTRTSPHTRSGTRSSPPPWMPVSPCGMSKKPHRMLIPEPPCATTGPDNPSTVTPPTSSPPT